MNNNYFVYVRRSYVSPISARSAGYAPSLLRDMPSTEEGHDALVDFFNQQITKVSNQVAELTNIAKPLSVMEERKLVFNLEALLNIKRELELEQRPVREPQGSLNDQLNFPL